jgi:hypothetical protein
LDGHDASIRERILSRKAEGYRHPSVEHSDIPRIASLRRRSRGLRDQRIGIPKGRLRM